MMECWNWNAGRDMRFNNFRGRSRAHSRKIAREQGSFERLFVRELWPAVVVGHRVEIKNQPTVRGNITYNRKGGYVRYSIPRPPSIFRK
jgi:hypothetical protein